MLITLCITFAALMVVSAVVVFLRSRRTAAPNRASPSARRRAVIADCGDDVVWEIGKQRPITGTPEFNAKISKRSFLKRSSPGAGRYRRPPGWPAHGRSVAFGSPPPAANRPLAKPDLSSWITWPRATPTQSMTTMISVAAIRMLTITLTSIMGHERRHRGHRTATNSPF